MTIHGRFVGDAPYLAAHVRHKRFHGLIWFLVDTVRLPSVLGRDIINRFRTVYDYRAGTVQLVG